MNEIVLPKTLNGLRRVSLADRGTMPRIPAVYCLLYRKRLVYVGSSANLWLRWRRHATIERCKTPQSAYIAWMPVKLPAMLATEQAFIDRFNPPWNKATARAPKWQETVRSDEKQAIKSINRQIRKNAKRNGYRVMPCPSTMRHRPESRNANGREIAVLEMLYQPNSWEFRPDAYRQQTVFLEAVYGFDSLETTQKYLHVSPDDSSGLYLDGKKG